MELEVAASTLLQEVHYQIILDFQEEDEQEEKEQLELIDKVFNKE